jgi:3-dehydrotetronate 4-kinase
MIGAIADDVTGATDLCSVLAAGGMRVVQTMGVVREVELPEVDAVVVALKSRTAPVGEAVTSSLDALEWLRDLGAAQIFFKVCSTFDSTPEGNIGPVADALSDALGAGVAVVTPAYPTNGRTVYQGHLFVGDRLLSESSMVHHPLTPMTDSDLVRVLGRQTPRSVGLVPLSVVRAGPEAIRARLGELGVSYTIADAVEDDDLRAIGAACAGLPLLVGGAGLALGLPANFGVSAHGAVPPPPPSGAAVVLAGSVSAATQEQVRRMAERHPAIEVDVDTRIDAVPIDVANGPVLVHSRVPPKPVERAQAEVIESKLAELAQRFVAAGARRVIVAGGETSGAVVQALGVRALAVGREIAPGVPWMTSLGDPPLALALKSGNFGGPDFFLEALAA